MKRPSAAVRNLRAEYLAHHPLCEYTLAAAGDIDFFAHAGLGGSWRYQKRPQATEIDHIFGRRGKEEDVEHASNYIATHTIPHKWKTDNDRDGRILAIWWKLQTDDLDVERVSRVFGQNVLGWVDNKLNTVELPEWIRQRALEVVNANE